MSPPSLFQKNKPCTEFTGAEQNMVTGVLWPNPDSNRIKTQPLTMQPHGAEENLKFLMFPPVYLSTEPETWVFTTYLDP